MEEFRLRKSALGGIRGRGFSAFVVATMSAGLLSVAPPGYATPEAPAGSASAAVQPEQGASEAAQALEEAKRTGKPVEVVSLRTETDEVYVNPDGTARADQSILPMRVRQGGRLVDIDPELATRSDGRVAPKASALSVSFSGGGDDAFVTMLREGRTVTLTWPHGKLPTPTVNGRTATYADVLPGVDLTATADDASFSHALVVKTPTAARHPDVRSVEFGLKTQGLALAQGATGEILAKTPSGNSLFTAPQPQMWDSAGSESATPVDPETPKGAKPVARSLQDTLDGATEGSRQAKLGVKLEEDKLVLTPDTGLLDDPKTVYPVVIDPKWGPDAWKNAWSIAYKHTAHPGSENTVYYNGGTISDYARVGYANDTTRGGTTRANTYFNIPVGSLAGKQVIDSTLRIKQTHAGSWSCNSGDLLVRTIGRSLPKNITYNNQPAWGAIVDSSGESFGGRNCPADTAGLVEFKVTSAISDAAAGRWGSWAFVLTSKSNAIDTSWRKFDPHSARVSTKYNTLPTKPKLSLDPSLPCAGGVIGATDEIVLRATDFKDAEDTNLTAEFRYALEGKAATSRSVSVSSGGTAMLRIPAGTKFPAGKYFYDAVIKDGVGIGEWAGRCYFTYDPTAPSKEPTVGSVQFPEDVNEACVNGQSTGRCAMPARTEGTFTFGANEVADVVEYVWWTDYDTKEKVVKPATAGGSATVKIRPLSAGPQYLYVRSEDAANNRSAVKAYLFTPVRSAERDRLGDMNGDGLVDLVTVDPGTGALWTYPGRGDGTFGTGKAANGASFAAGPVTNGGSWSDDDLYEDVIALQPSADKSGVYELNVYRGNGNGELRTDADAVKRLQTADEDRTDPVTGASTNEHAHWRNGAEILSVPSFSDEGGGGPERNQPDGQLTDDDHPDLLVKEGSSLWLYLGRRGDNLLDNGGPPIALGNADWQNMTLMTPGDLNKDGIPEIWARDTVSGAVHQYTSRKAAAPDHRGILADLSVFADPEVRTTSIGTGFKGTDHPHLTTTGDFEGDGHADLWSRDGAGRTVEFPGRSPVAGSAFGAARLLATTGYSWADCKTFPPASGSKSFSICGPILGKYESLGGVAGFGKPTGDLTNVSDGGRFVNFAEAGTATTNRAISWSKATGAWSVADGVFTRWNSIGRETGTLGYPTSDEHPTHVAGGTVITFGKAGSASAIYSHVLDGSQVVRGAIHSQYVKLGGPAVYGYPVGAETTTATKPGAVQHFRHLVTGGHNVSFYWSSATGAWPVVGSIRTHWLSLNGHNGNLGFPTSIEYPVYGGQRSDFQTGYVRWNRESYQVAAHTPTDRTAHLRTDLAGDYDGDGRTDIYTVYNYEKDSIGLYVAKANADGGHNPPQEYFATENPGDWNYSHSKWTSGDFDGDGRDDLMGFYGYSDGRVTAFSFLTQPAGRPVLRTSINLATGWNWSRSTQMAADLNGDGRDDLAFVYDYGDGIMGVFKALARADGTFENPVRSFVTEKGHWWASNARYTIGDTNGDGRDDIVALYGYSTGEARLFTMTAKADGNLNHYTDSWSVPSGVWERDRGKMTMADFNKDGREDLAVMYGYDDGRTEIRIFHARADGGFGGFVTPYASLPGNWYATSTGNLVSGDVNGDGRPDITVSYNYASGQMRLFTFYGNEEGTTDPPTFTWYAPAGTW
ncbi:FG-GAP-like repeat-containing protein [Streptomyces sp. NPDC056529]|uniref:FG-GAP-like repeat-containing protein n=1 Tax=Streptomyces sp. NPDC056529 TaxID=3345855 RepID=UPI00368B9A04